MQLGALANHIVRTRPCCLSLKQPQPAPRNVMNSLIRLTDEASALLQNLAGGFLSFDRRHVPSTQLHEGIPTSTISTAVYLCTQRFCYTPRNEKLALTLRSRGCLYIHTYMVRMIWSSGLLAPHQSRLKPLTDYGYDG